MSYADRYNEKRAINRLHREYKVRDTRKPREAYLLDGVHLYFDDGLGLMDSPLTYHDAKGVKVG